jgi:hypothetical protein
MIAKAWTVCTNNAYWHIMLSSVSILLLGFGYSIYQLLIFNWVAIFLAHNGREFT